MRRPSHQEVRSSEYRNFLFHFEAEPLVESDIFRTIRLQVSGGRRPIEILAIETQQALADAATLGSGIDPDWAEVAMRILGIVF